MSDHHQRATPEQIYASAFEVSQFGMLAYQRHDRVEAQAHLAMAATLFRQGAAMDPNRQRAATMEINAAACTEKVTKLLGHTQQLPPPGPTGGAHATPARSRSPNATAPEQERKGDRHIQHARNAHGEMKWLEAEKQLGLATEAFLGALRLHRDAEDQKRLQQKATMAMDLLEKLQDARKDKMDAPPPPPSQRQLSPALQRRPQEAAAASSESLSPAEILVLRDTSNVNGRVYPPWIAADAGHVHVAGGSAFVDPDGALRFSDKQMAAGAVWARPSDLSSNPTVLEKLSSQNVKQTLVSDCSFVSALAISADYERRFKQRVVTAAIFPQNSRGQPVYNPQGKYVLRLHFNGVWRKVVVDDRLPVDAGTHRLLCSYSANPNEFWVSLLEKAYMKVMANGYDFPGSNSSVDLHAMSGWIPDRLPVEKCQEGDWQQLYTSLHQGQVLITAATGEMSEAEASRAGLVTSHAYALLDMRIVGEEKLVRLKNPWAHMRWKGNYSPFDARHWTPRMIGALQYDVEAAKSTDDGTFWIDWGSMQRFFDVMYMNWNPARFPHVTTYHYRWLQTAGPAKDSYNMEHNPQYSVSVTASESCELWVLLSRHITHLEDFAHNKEFIGIHVFGGGKRIFIPEAPIFQPVKINSPHFLAKLKLPAGQQKLTLVVSQFEKANTLSFTLKVYCTCPFKMAPLLHAYPEQTRMVGKWEGITAGGCQNNRSTYQNNPRYHFQGPGDGNTITPVLIKIEGPREFSVGVTVKGNNGSTTEVPAYRPGFAFVEMNVTGGIFYEIVPATFNAGEESAFFLTLASKMALPLLEGPAPH